MPAKQHSLEEKYDEIQQLIIVGKERGYLLFDEINELLPTGATSPEELDELFSMLGSLGIEVLESEDKYKEKKLLQKSSDEPDTDIQPVLLEKTSDPVRMYLREMGSIELLSRESEIRIAKRIEAGKNQMIGGISESPLTMLAIANWLEDLRNEKILLRERMYLKIFQI